MSPKVSATYRIKLQIFLTLNLAFKKAGAIRPGSTTRNPGLHQRPSPKSSNGGERPKQKPGSARTYPLGMVLEACPDILDFASGGISSWRDLATTAAVVRSAIGVSPDAWAQALRGFGRARRVDRHRRDPAARRGNQERRRLSARADREGEGRGVLARSRADGACCAERRRRRARTKRAG